MNRLTIAKIETLLGNERSTLLDFNSPKVAKDMLHLPNPDSSF